MARDYSLSAPMPATSQRAPTYMREIAAAGVIFTSLSLSPPTIPNQPYSEKISPQIISESALPTINIVARVRKQSRITALIKRLHQQLTPEQRAQLPTDFSNNTDTLVYGS